MKKLFTAILAFLLILSTINFVVSATNETGNNTTTQENLSTDENTKIATVTEVRFAESEIEVEIGSSALLPNVTVSGDNSPSQEITLIVTGHSSESTVISQGQIFIGDDESAESFTVTATSVADTTKSAILTVKVTSSEPRTPFDKESVVIRFGVVSDVHQDGYYAGTLSYAQQQEWSHVIDVFQKTAEADNAVLDAILVNGDLTDGIANNGSNVGSFKTYGDKALQNMRECGFFAHGVWGSDTGVEFTEAKKVSDETKNSPASYKEATSVFGRGNGFDPTTKLFYVLGNHDESGRGVSTPKAAGNKIDDETLKFSPVYSADYFGAVICGWQHDPDSEEATTNSIGGTGTYQDGFDHSYRNYFADLIDYNTNPTTTVTKDTFEAAYGVKLASADALFDKYYGHLDVDTTLTDTENGIRFGNSHMTIDPNPDNGVTTDRIHFIGVELSQSNESCAWAEEIIKTSVAEDPSKPIFMITHYKMPDTMIGDSGVTRLQSIIKNYPQVIIWGGHSHTTMHTDNAINSEQGYVAVESNTTRYMSTGSSLTVSSKFGSAYTPSKDYPSSPYNYPNKEAAVSNGCYVEVDKNNNVRINRVDIYRSFSTDYAEDPDLFTVSKYTNFNSHKYNPDFKAVDKVVFIREPWDITDIETGKHLDDFNTTTRTENTKTPYFEDSTSISATGIIGGLDVSITMNAKDDDGMVMLYVLEVKDSDGNVAHRRYYTNFFYEFPQSDATLAGNDIPDRTERAVITELEQNAEYTVSLFAVDEYYVAGEAISTSATTIEGAEEITLPDGRIGVFVDTTGEYAMYEWTDGVKYLVYSSYETAIASGADVLYVIKSPIVSNSLRDSVVNKQTKALEIIGVAEDRADAVLSWANAVYISKYDLTLTNMGLNKEASGDCALHAYNGHTLTLNDCLATSYAINVFTAYGNGFKTGNLRITGDSLNIESIWTSSTYNTGNTSVIGDVTLTLEGGTYKYAVHSMKCASKATDPYNSLDGNLYINVSGGTFADAVKGSHNNKRSIITKNSVVNVTGGTIAKLGNTGTSYVQGKEVYIITDSVLETTTYTASKDASGNTKSILITIPANEGGIGEATLDATTGYITSYAVKQVAGKASFVNGAPATSITLEDGKNYTVTYLKAYSVDFNINGGEGTAPETYIGTPDEVYTDLPDNTGFEKENYNFLGWALTPDATEAIDSVNITYEGVILYAVWKPKEQATVTLVAGDGTIAETTVTVFRGDETLLPTAYKPKAVFAGWAESEDATEGSYTYTVPLDVEAKTLYAVYTEVGMDVIYVDTTAETNGDGRTSLSPMNDWLNAMKAGSAEGTKYILMTSTIVSENATVGSTFGSAKGALWLTNIDPVTGAKFNSAAVFSTNGHYSKKDVTYDIPLAAINHSGMHINFNGYNARFTDNVSFIEKDEVIPGMTETCSSVPYFRGGSDSGNKSQTSLTFDYLDVVQNRTIYIVNQFGDTVTNANVIINDGTVSKTFNMASGLATIANVVINDYSAKAEIKIDKPESCTTLNYILNNDTAELVTVPTGDNIYVVKSSSDGTVSPTTTPGTFKIVAKNKNVVINGTVAEKSDDDLYTLSGSEDGVYNITYKEIEKSININVKIPREDGIKPYNITYDDGTTYNNATLIEIYNGDILVHSAREDAQSGLSEVNTSADLLSGTYRIEITKNGYIKYVGAFEVASEDLILPDFELIAGDIKESYTDNCGNGVIDINDFIRALRGFTPTSDIKVKNAVDINEDGVVNVVDLGYIKANFGKSYK